MTFKMLTNLTNTMASGVTEEKKSMNSSKKLFDIKNKLKYCIRI